MSSKEVTLDDLCVLLDTFEKTAYVAAKAEEGSLQHTVLEKCEALFDLDYTIAEIDNEYGNLTSRYPQRIFMPENEKCNMTRTITPDSISCQSGGNGLRTSEDNTITMASEESEDSREDQEENTESIHKSQPTKKKFEEMNSSRVRELVLTAKYARCRQRFVVPVLIYRGNCVCRSATVSVVPETNIRKAFDYACNIISGSTNNERESNDENKSESIQESIINETKESGGSAFSNDCVINTDIKLLRELNVTNIVDLMVENRKIKYYMTVSSSEKVENQYEDFNILSLPYPGCEFFKKFRDNNYLAKNLIYNWEDTTNDAPLNIPILGPASDLDINWSDYTKWDLVEITQNYLKVILKYIKEENTGLLIHCISGWDRTPLFISLVRLSLWADGLIHQSLSAIQMTYLTLAYDWYLFGHQLPDRLKRGEEIMFFCFYNLKYIMDEEFSFQEHRKRTKTVSSNGSSIIVLSAETSEEENYFDIAITDNFYAATTNTTSATTVPTTPKLTTTAATPPKSSPTSLNSTPRKSTSSARTSESSPSSGHNSSANTTPPIANRSPNSKRNKTSPISVPGSERRRLDSTTMGGWNMVSETGSIDSTISGCSFINISETPSSCETNSSNSHEYSASARAAAFAEAQLKRRGPQTLRQQRLNAVRTLFIQSYGKAIGLKFKEGSNSGISSIIGTLTDQLFI